MHLGQWVGFGGDVARVVIEADKIEAGRDGCFVVDAPRVRVDDRSRPEQLPVGAADSVSAWALIVRPE